MTYKVPYNSIHLMTACLLLALPQQTTFPVTPSLATSPTMAFSPYLSHVSPGMGLMPAELLPNTPVLVSSNPAVSVPGGSAGQKLMRTDKLEVFALAWIPLPYFVKVSMGEFECRLLCFRQPCAKREAHPGGLTIILL